MVAGSRERGLRVREALLHFLHRAGLSTVLILDVGANRPAFFLEQLQRLANRRLALAPWRVVTLVLLPILQVQVRDVGVVLTDVRDRIEVRRGEVPDVEVHLEVLRHLHRRREAVGRAELVRVGRVRLAVHGDDHAVLPGERRHSLRRFEIRRRRDDLSAERLRHLEAAVDLGIGVLPVRAVVVGVHLDAGLPEPVSDCAKVIEGRFEPPLPQVLARLDGLRRRRITAPSARAAVELRLDLRRKQLALEELTLLERPNDLIDGVAARRSRQIAEAVALRTEADAVEDRCRRLQPDAREREACESEVSEFASGDHDRFRPAKASRSFRYGLTVNEYSVSPAATSTCCRPSIRNVSGALDTWPICACQSGLPFAGSNATKFPDTSPPKSSFPAVASRPGAPPPRIARNLWRQTILPVSGSRTGCPFAFSSGFAQLTVSENLLVTSRSPVRRSRVK